MVHENVREAVTGCGMGRLRKRGGGQVWHGIAYSAGGRLFILGGRSASLLFDNRKLLCCVPSLRDVTLSQLHETSCCVHFAVWPSVQCNVQLHVMGPMGKLTAALAISGILRLSGEACEWLVSRLGRFKPGEMNRRLCGPTAPMILFCESDRFSHS